MHKNALIGTILALAVFGWVVSAAGATIQDFLGAPTLYVQYDVSFKVAHAAMEKHEIGNTKTIITMNRSFSSLAVLDMRMDGPSTTLNAQFLGGGDKSKITAADAMKFQQDMLARMETAANWMSTGGMMSIDADAPVEEQEAAMAAARKATLGPGTMDYVRIDSSWGLVDEMGNPYNLEVRITWNGSGKVLAGGGANILCEIDAPKKGFVLALPHVFHEMETRMKRVTTTARTDVNWNNPDVRKDSSEVGMNIFPSQIDFDDPKALQAGMAIIRGTFDPSSGKIEGEHSLAAHYTDQYATIPGTITINYSLTLTPPTKKK